jgi:hypothetical protein
MPVCPKCGTNVVDSAAQFCPSCGATLPQATPSGGTSTPPPASPSPTPSSGGASSFSPMGAFRSAIDLVKNPIGFMNANKDSPATVQDIMIKYVAILAAIPFVATLIGNLWFYGIFGGIFARVFVGYAFVEAILGYIFNLISVFVVGYVIKMLAPSFNSTPDQVKALKLASYIYTPYFLLSIFNIIPLLGIIAVLGLLYGLYILYKGLPIMVSTPQDKVIVYLIVTLVVTFVVLAIFGAITGAIVLAAFAVSAGFLL